VDVLLAEIRTLQKKNVQLTEKIAVVRESLAALLGEDSPEWPLAYMAGRAEARLKK
jgi:hypothetical protein